jgi:hypothetical protein
VRCSIDDAQNVRFDGRQVTLNGPAYRYWLQQFEAAGADGMRLQLALTQIVPYLQPNSGRPLETQVSSQLARIVGDISDRNRRYQQRVAAGDASGSRKSKADEAREFLKEIGL